MNNKSLIELLRENKDIKLEIINLPLPILGCACNKIIVVSFKNNNLFQIFINEIILLHNLIKYDFRIISKYQRNINYKLLGYQRNSIYYNISYNINTLLNNIIKNFGARINKIKNSFLKFLMIIRLKNLARKKINKFINKYKEHYLCKPPNEYNKKGGLYYIQAMKRFMTQSII